MPSDEYLIHDGLDGNVEALQAFNRILEQRRDLLAALEMVTDGYGHTWPVAVLEIVNAARVKATKGEA